MSVLIGTSRVLVRGPSRSDYNSGKIDIYDPQTNAWSLATKLATDLVGASTTRLADGRALLAGGAACCNPEGVDPPPLKSAVIYNPSANSWSATREMISARRNHTATLLPSGLVLVAGGFDRTVTPNPSPNPFGPTAPLVKDLTLASAELFDPRSNGWMSAGTMATARTGHTAIPLRTGKVLVLGGATMPYNLDDGTRKILGSAELYDPATNSWSSAGKLDTARSGYAATELNDGRVLVIGGLGPAGSPALNTVEVYDPTSNSWAAAGRTTSGRAYHTATLLKDGRVLVAGGVDRGGRLSSAEIFEPSTGSWTLVSSMAISRSNHRAVLLPSGKVLVTGGTGPSGDLASAELYDPDGTGAATSPPLTQGSGKWLSAARMATERGYGTNAAVLKDGKVAVLGGFPSESAIELYNPTMDAWANVRTPPKTQGNPTMTLLNDGRLLLAGGQDSNGEGLATVQIYDPFGDTWTAGTSMPSGRWGHLPVLLHDGRVLVVGGTDSHRLLGPVVYDPGANTWRTADSFPELKGPLPSTWTATVLKGGQVLVTTTAIGPAGASASGWVFQPSTDTWSPAGTMKIARIEYTATLLSSGAVLFIGGIVMESSGGLFIAKAAANTELWEPVTQTFRSVAGMSNARYFHTATLLTDGRVLVVGGAAGENYSGDPLAGCELYDPVANTWSPAASLAAARRSHASVLLADGRVLTVGGVGLFGALADDEIYTPAKVTVQGSPGAGKVAPSTTAPATPGRRWFPVGIVTGIVGLLALVTVLGLRSFARLRRKRKRL